MEHEHQELLSAMDKLGAAVAVVQSDVHKHVTDQGRGAYHARLSFRCP
jgi:hypothetical protein